MREVTDYSSVDSRDTCSSVLILHSALVSCLELLDEEEEGSSWCASCIIKGSVTIKRKPLQRLIRGYGGVEPGSTKRAQISKIHLQQPSSLYEYQSHWYTHVWFCL